MDVNLLNEKIEEQGITSFKLSRIFRLVAGNSLADCAKLRVSALKEISSDMVGTNEELAEQILLDSIMLAISNSGESIPISTQNAELVAISMGCTPVLSSVEDVRERICGRVIEVESYTEEYKDEEVKGINFDEEDEEDELDRALMESLANRGVEEVVEVEEVEEPKDTEEDTEPNEEVNVDLKEEQVLRYYSQYLNGVTQELVKRYTALFSSGYELERPAGLLTKDGIVRVSGSQRVVYEDSVATTNIYSIMKDNLKFTEVETRSIVGIANAIYEGFSSGGKLLYLPNKMLEFAYGLCAPDGENQNSLNTYKKHSDANNWKAYCSKELEKAIQLLVRKSVYGFISNVAPDGNYKDPSIIQSLGSYLGYMQGCLSLCLLFSDYKVVTIKGMRDVSSIKLRICDPEARILEKNILPLILDKAFMGGVGTVPFSYQPRVAKDVYVVEYAHEFNHDMAQSTPLFAYKALQALKEQGIELSFNKLILGKAEDGSILRGGTHGVDLSKNLTHNITAGSQAGKGVMTLNILASGIASKKNCFYLDRKPDMASMLKYLAPNMPVVNGSDIQKGYDGFNQWQDADSLLGNVPDEVLKAFNVNQTWNDLGDLIYMRTLKLVIALIMVRGSGHIEKHFGGEQGVLLVVDEFSNFQRSYMNLISNLTSILPPIVLEKAKAALQEKKITKPTFDRVYNNASYYALSYLNSMMADIEYLKSKKDAGYDPLETARSDIFVIGQSLEKGMFDYEEFKHTFSNNSSSGRYKSIDASGITKGSFAVGNQSIPFNIVNFKTADAFFGRNMDDGRAKYLAQTNKNSKANGRLDDKASNFAYLSNFSEDTRKKIVNGSESDNVNLANSCVYFKPFLILNSSGMQDKCVQKMFERVHKNAGVSKEELIAENPSQNNPNAINEAVGFIDYIKMAGIQDASEILEKSSSILNFIVQQVLKYPGNWFQFVTDFSPEWLFTIKDVVDAVETGTCGLYNPNTNPILQEYVDFNPNRFKGGFEDETTESLRVMDKFFYNDSSEEDFSDMEAMQKAEDERLGDVMGDYDSFDAEEEILLDDDIKEDAEDIMYQPINDNPITETGKPVEKDIEDEETQKILDLIKQLNDLGVNIQVGEDENDPNPISYQGTEKSEFGEELENLNFEEEIDSLSVLMSVITNDLLEKFGGLERINSFKVIGGSLVVNGYYYRCKVKDLYIKNIPYDIRRDINSGNISKLFNYSLIRGMRHIRDLEIDSVNFAYDYVSSQLGYGASVGVDRFFDDLPSLQVVTIGKNRFKKDSYMEELRKSETNDIFYRPRKITVLADASEQWVSKAFDKSWGFTKKLATNKNCNKAVKVLGVTAGGLISATTGVTKVGTKATRSAVKNLKILSRGIKNLFDS